MAIEVPGSTANCLEQASFISQEALAVSVKDCNKAHFRQIKSFSEQIDAHNHIDVADSQGIDDLGSFNGVDF
jgi:hypothetical protein